MTEMNLVPLGEQEYFTMGSQSAYDEQESFR